MYVVFSYLITEITGIRSRLLGDLDGLGRLKCLGHVKHEDYSYTIK